MSKGIGLRIKELREVNKLTQTEFSERIGIKQANLSHIENKGEKISVDIISRIISNFNINIEWLFTGKGVMSKTNIDNSSQTLRNKEIANEETRPRIPMDAAAGSLTVSSDGITMNNCEQLPVIRAFPRYDFTIFARGESMDPEYHSGDELACIYIRNTSFIQWGRIHVIDTAQGILVKRIFDGGDSIICKSDNLDYPDFRIHKSEFYNVALVIGMIRRY
ncbi:XRE family transcriptional regulator [Dysgonomonas sp. ZJ279]|uniref:XRE family transcriptional regulator n=1 Tax=Dysgonomonas sp. ZJ279 TaxID=2709796 RepID=UPI0013EBEFA9|nr:LexA family transcriptional regulator [Dysgonomonas sp. ZJ279]